MFIIIQQPFIDLRLIKNDGNDNNFFPHTWPVTDSYFRYFGNKFYRRNPANLPLAEQTFYQSQKIFSRIEHPSIKGQIVFSRLFVDNFFFHFDIGIKINGYHYFDDPSQILEDLLQNGYLYAPAHPNRRLPFARKDWQQYLSNLYFYATTKIINKIPFSAPPNERFDLYFGQPAIFCQGKFAGNMFKGYSIVPNIQDDVVLYKGTFNTQKYFAHLWIMQKGSDKGEGREQLRSIRICLLKLHNYREGLIGLFKYLINTPLEPLNVDILHHQIAYLLRLLQRTELHGVAGKQIMDHVIQSDVDIFYETWDLLICDLKECYEEIKSMKKEGRVIVKQINFNGDVHNTGTLTVGDNNEIKYTDNKVIYNFKQNEDINNFFKEYQRLVDKMDAAANKEKLTSQKGEMEKAINSGNKSTFEKIWSEAKNIFMTVLGNADNISTLAGVIINILSKLPK